MENELEKTILRIVQAELDRREALQKAVAEKYLLLLEKGLGGIPPADEA